jgi:AmmeMemoRadiSam system protein B/AmmeMemoRadiSam system protein A
VNSGSVGIMKAKLWLGFALILSLASCGGPAASPVRPVPTAATPPTLAEKSASSSSPTDEPAATPTFTGPVQRPVVAGSFYPADADSLAAVVEAMLAEVEPLGARPIALVAPHAGYIYSGSVAAHAFKQVQGQAYDVIVVVGTNHRRPDLRRVAVYPDGAFATPLGEVPVDAGLAAELVAADERIIAERSVFAEEHSLEVELPFLQRLLPGCPIVPIMVGEPSWENVVALSDALVGALAGRDALIVASTDLSHYPAYEDAVAVDGALLQAVETMDPERVRTTVDEMMGSGVPGLATCACGEGPLLVAMRAAAGLGANHATVIDYRNSGDSPVGERSQVVGYGAVMFWQGDEDPAPFLPPAPAAPAPEADLSADEQIMMLRLARETLERFLATGSFPSFRPGSPGLLQVRGVFVTLRRAGELRGCIGSLIGGRPLYLEVQRSTVLAALDDPRFPPVTMEELPELDLEISVLGPMEPVIDVTTIQVGVHGLLIVQAGKQGVLLPQVPVEEAWDRDEFLVQVCRKANLPDDAWQTADLYRFTTQVFEE